MHGREAGKSGKFTNDLIVEDELIRFWSMTLKEGGFYTAIAPSSEEAVTLLKGINFHALVTDINLKGTDGWEENRPDRSIHRPSAGRFARNQNGERKVVVIIRKLEGKRSLQSFALQYLEPKAQRWRLCVRTSLKERSFMPTKPDHGTTLMSVSRLSGSTMRRPIHKTVLARIGRKSFSVACVVLRSGTTTTLQARTFPATPKTLMARDTARSRMAIR
jgi:CheY-like chemotaxis protein